MPGRTTVSIDGERFFINGAPTYAGRRWNGFRIEGLLLNSRMVNAIFDDLNPDTRNRWAYRDTGAWDAERNSREFLTAMPLWREHGLLAVTVNLQGGSPEGYSRAQPWHNSAFDAEGSLRDDYLGRLARVIERADELGMVVILGLFYFGQDYRLRDEAAVIRAAEQAVRWLLDRGYSNVLVEIANECDIPAYTHEIIKPPREHELIRHAQSITKDGRRLLVSTSYQGRSIPGEEAAAAADFLLLHGNFQPIPQRLAHQIRMTRRVPGYAPKPVLINEDDHFDFDRPWNNLRAAISEYCSWGFFDPYGDGFQSPPIEWGMPTGRKRAFFEAIREITGAGGE